MTEDYRVQLDVFSGPLDLLLYLVRRDEVAVQDIVVARITDQYVKYVRLLEQLDPNAAGDFLVMAAALIEMKSRALLPTPPLEALDEQDDPRAGLVRQLLEYKRFKDATARLRDSAEERAQRFVRIPSELPPELQGVELEDAEVWDLLEAFGRVMTAIGQGPGVHQVRYDDRPIEEYATIVLDALERGPATFQSLFVRSSTRAEVISMLLALLELIRKQRIKAQQETAYGTIYLFRLDEAPEAEPMSPESVEGVPEIEAPAPAAEP